MSMLWLEIRRVLVVWLVSALARVIPAQDRETLAALDALVGAMGRDWGLPEQAPPQRN